MIYKESCQLFYNKKTFCNFLIHNTLIKYDVTHKLLPLKNCYFCI